MSKVRAAWAGLALVAPALLALTGPSAAFAARLKVCAFSFNTPHEIQAFASSLPAEDFDVVDLTPHPLPTPGTGSPDAGENGSGSWLPGLCRRDLQCDVVVFSAEFAGGFFGTSGVSLSIQDMEEQSCRPQCDGLFHHPQEVFLLACNTLATKDEDRRTPDAYLEILLDHGFDRAAAERVVALRYGPLGPSFREASRRIFMGVPRIYGFSSVGPPGEYTAPRLERYFRAKRDYRRYLDRAHESTASNRELLAAFGGTGLVQVTGLSPSEPAAADRADLCRLYDESASLADRFRIVGRLFDRGDILAFVPAIEVFIGHHPPEELQGEERRLFEEIQHREAARSEVLRLVRELDVSALQMELADLARHLEWMPREEFQSLAVAGARELLARPFTSEIVDVMCEIPRHESIGDAFTSADLPDRLFENAEGIRLVDCLSPTDERVSGRLAPGLDSDNEGIRLWTAYALSRRLPLDDATLTKVADHLDDTSSDVRERLQWILRTQAQQSEHVRRVVERHDPALASELWPRESGRRRPLQ